MPGAPRHRPLISVIMPVRDAAAFVEDAVQSTLAQTLTDFELIVVDDGSRDHSVRVIEMYARMDERVRLYRQPWQGIAAALNHGLAEATGEFVARMDADDVAQPERFEQQAAYLIAHAEVGVVGGATLLMRQDGRPIRALKYPQHDGDIRRVLERTSGIAHPTAMMRASLLREVGAYRTAFVAAEDYDLWLRLGERALLANLPRAVVRYRVHARQESANNIAHQVVCCIGARYSARLRAEQRVDLMNTAGAVSLDLLAHLGVVDTSAVKNEVVSVLARRALFFAHIGELHAARRLVSEAVMRAAEVELSARPRACLAAAQAVLLVREGRITSACRSFAGAVAASPPSVAALAWRWMRQLVPGG